MMDLLNEPFGPAYEDHIRSGTKYAEVAAYAAELARGVEAHRKSLDNLICAVARNWKLERMATVDRNVIRIALYEMLMRKDIPAKVAINEAVDLGKRYGDSESGSFVNGILDRIRIESVEAASQIGSESPQDRSPSDGSC